MLSLLRSLVNRIKLIRCERNGHMFVRYCHHEPVESPVHYDEYTICHRCWYAIRVRGGLDDYPHEVWGRQSIVFPDTNGPLDQNGVHISLLDITTMVGIEKDIVLRRGSYTVEGILSRYIKGRCDE